MIGIRKLAQSTFVFSHGESRLLIDPGKYNLTKGYDVAQIGRIDQMVITHEHADHFDLELTRSLVKAYSPNILTNAHIATILRREGISAKTGDVGQQHVLGPFNLVLTKTDHVVREVEPENFGMVICCAGKRLYHTSDTRLIEPQVLACPEAMEADVLMVPISNRGIVMGIDDALYFTDAYKPKMVIPMHYNSPKDESRIHPSDFVARATALSSSLPHLQSIEFRIMDVGEEFVLDEETQ